MVRENADQYCYLMEILVGQVSLGHSCLDITKS